MSGESAVRRSFLVFPLEDRRFALPTEDVVELSRSGQVQRFPHTSELLDGVMVLRGGILPVWDLAKTLLGESSATQKAWLVTRCNYSGDERTAIPVSGECQMIHAAALPPLQGSPVYILGVLKLEDQLIEILDLRQLGPQPGEFPQQDLHLEKKDAVL